MTAVPTRDILGLRVHEQRAAFFEFFHQVGVSNPLKIKQLCKWDQLLYLVYLVSKGNDETSWSRRMHIYVSLLKQMAPEHLLQTFVKLCSEILAAASDGMLNIDDITGQAVLQDAFQIIACKEIRIPSNRGLSSDTGDIDEEAADNGGAAAKGRAITQALKKGPHPIQSTVPIFLELKRLLESKNSSLIGSLMECLRIILKDYKNEIEDILVADKQLQKELIHDMQKTEF